MNFYTNTNSKPVIIGIDHGYGNINTARADCNLTDAAACGSVRIGAEKRSAGLAIAFEMKLMTDAIAGLGIDYAVFFCD